MKAKNAKAGARVVVKYEPHQIDGAASCIGREGTVLTTSADRDGDVRVLIDGSTVDDYGFWFNVGDLKKAPKPVSPLQALVNEAPAVYIDLN